MKPNQQLRMLTLVAWLTTLAVSAQTYVTPKLGGGQAAADMIHIDIWYDADMNVLHANVDDSYGIPELRALESGYAFDPEAAYAVLSGKAYNAQYGWNAGGLFAIPPGAAIWIELLGGSAGLETYEGSGRFAGYDPIFGTDGSSLLWKWSGVMVHNTYAVLNPVQDRYFAEYRVYFGDQETGARDGFQQYDEAFVRLEWTTVPVADPLLFQFGATSTTDDAPLSFLNADSFVTNAEFVASFRQTNSGPAAGGFIWNMPCLVLPATATNGGPQPGHPAPGACVELQLLSLTGPAGGQVSVWHTNENQPRFSLPVGLVDGTNSVRLTAGEAVPSSDPFGSSAGKFMSLNQPGLYCLGFRLIDVSTNGLAGEPIHTPSEPYTIYLQAGAVLAGLEKQGSLVTVTVAGDPESNFYLERTALLGPNAQWETVGGPIIGDNRLQRLTDTTATQSRSFYRVRIDSP